MAKLRRSSRRFINIARGAADPPLRAFDDRAVRHRHRLCSFLLVHTITSAVRKTESDPDIFFHCQHCKAALVANKSAAGMNLACQKCGQQTLVPQPEAPSAVSAEFANEIQRKLKENESQRAEVTGYINQLTIQLHRWQLRLQTLNERKAQLEKEL
jgi:DNA-directed RNA polymerase subunit M/transcription elongation factor TFIIS